MLFYLGIGGIWRPRFSFMPASDIYDRGVDEGINITGGHKWKTRASNSTNARKNSVIVIFLLQLFL